MEGKGEVIQGLDVYNFVETHKYEFGADTPRVWGFKLSIMVFLHAYGIGTAHGGSLTQFRQHILFRKLKCPIFHRLQEDYFKAKVGLHNTGEVLV